MISLLRLPVVGLLFILSVVQAQSCVTPKTRREWRQLTEDERASWISAVKCLAQVPHNSSLTPTLNISESVIPPVNTSSSFYDDIVYVHMDLNQRIHYTGLFLPWHRAFLQLFEDSLEDLCGYTGAQPYWDWSSDAADILNSDIWDPSPTSGLGYTGDPDDIYQVIDGGFAEGFTVSYPVQNRVRRNITEQPWRYRGTPFRDHTLAASLSPTKYANTTFSPIEVNRLVEGFAGDFLSFQEYLEFPQGPHNGVHFLLGGDLSGNCPSNAPECILGAKWSPNEPMFWLHHAMIDKIWWDWQNRRPQNFWSFVGGSLPSLATPLIYQRFPNGLPPFLGMNQVINLDGLYHNLTIYDVLDIQGGPLCYTYE